MIFIIIGEERLVIIIWVVHHFICTLCYSSTTVVFWPLDEDFIVKHIHNFLLLYIYFIQNLCTIFLAFLAVLMGKFAQDRP